METRLSLFLNIKTILQNFTFTGHETVLYACAFKIELHYQYRSAFWVYDKVDKGTFKIDTDFTGIS